MPMPKQKPGRSKQNYRTPAVFINAVLSLLEIDKFTFDFAAEKQTAQAARYWTKEQNSFLFTCRQWKNNIGNGWGWLNPPFGDITPWAERCKQVSRLDARIAFLVPASVGSNWYRDHVDRFAFTLFLNGRIPFIENRPTWLYPKDCMLCLYDPTLEPGNEVWTWR